MPDEILALVFSEQRPASGTRTVSAVDEAEHDLVDADSGGQFFGPLFRKRDYSTVGCAVTVVEQYRSGASSADSRSDGGNIDYSPILAATEQTETVLIEVPFGLEGCVELKLPLITVNFEIV